MTHIQVSFQISRLRTTMNKIHFDFVCKFLKANSSFDRVLQSFPGYRSCRQVVGRREVWIYNHPQCLYNIPPETFNDTALLTTLKTKNSQLFKKLMPLTTQKCEHAVNCVCNCSKILSFSYLIFKSFMPLWCFLSGRQFCTVES